MHSAFLVEDSPPARETLTFALAESAAIETVGYAESELEAVDWLSSHEKPDLVVLDLFLNAGTGLGVLAKIRQMALQDLRVIVLTNSATSLLRRSCMLLGAEAVYDKADNLEEFLEHCRGMFDEPPAH